jgi:hypothetical protein
LLHRLLSRRSLPVLRPWLPAPIPTGQRFPALIPGAGVGHEHPVWRAEPNAGHAAVAELASSGIGTTVVTQNTDGLHQCAGTPADRVIELHGTMHHVICAGCGHRSATVGAMARMDAGEAVPQASPAPSCPLT